MARLMDDVPGGCAAGNRPGCRPCCPGARAPEQPVALHGSGSELRSNLVPGVTRAILLLMVPEGLVLRVAPLGTVGCWTGNWRCGGPPPPALVRGRSDVSDRSG